jgi:hypothetical protein
MHIAQLILHVAFEFWYLDEEVGPQTTALFLEHLASQLQKLKRLVSWTLLCI